MLVIAVIENMGVVMSLNSTIENKPKLLDQVHLTFRTQHYSLCAEEVYVGWIKKLVVSIQNMDIYF